MCVAQIVVAVDLETSGVVGVLEQFILLVSHIFQRYITFSGCDKIQYNELFNYIPKFYAYSCVILVLINH